MAAWDRMTIAHHNRFGHSQANIEGVEPKARRAREGGARGRKMKLVIEVEERDFDPNIAHVLFASLSFQDSKLRVGQFLGLTFSHSFGVFRTAAERLRTI